MQTTTELFEILITILPVYIESSDVDTIRCEILILIDISIVLLCVENVVTLTTFKVQNP